MPVAALLNALFRAVWGGGPCVTAPAEVARIATVAGLDGTALVAEATGTEAKRRLRKQTEDAAASGVFGVPTMLAGGAPLFTLFQWVAIGVIGMSLASSVLVLYLRHRFPNRVQPSDW